MEDKNERFKRVAENRVNKTIHLIQLIGNLSNTRNYKYTNEEVDKIFKILTKELRNSKIRFEEGLSTNNKPFKL